MKILLLWMMIFISSCSSLEVMYGDKKLSNLGLKMNHNSSINSSSLEAEYLNLLYKELGLEKSRSRLLDDPEYVVEMNLNWADAGSLRRGSGSFARKNVNFYVSYVIKNKDGEVLDKDTIRTIDSSDISTSRFTNYSLDDFVLHNLMRISVMDLRNRIVTVLYNTKN